MLTPPELSDDVIARTVRDAFDVHPSVVAFIPLGADVNAAVYRLDAADGAAFFLKLRRGAFNPLSVVVPAWLHAQGIADVMAPLTSVDGAAWVERHGYRWMLYPFFEGRNGFQIAPSPAQWVKLGRVARQVHDVAVSDGFRRDMRRETFDGTFRDMARAFRADWHRRTYDDPLAEAFAAFCRANDDGIMRMVERAGQLAGMMLAEERPFVICHADLHGGNVLLGDDRRLAVVDWDEVMLAPRERDLMFVGGGLYVSSAAEVSSFYEGYGDVVIDRVALAYYRYERIVVDLVEFAKQVLGVQGSAEDREQSLGYWTGQFEPGEVVEVAHATYRELASPHLSPP